MVFGHGFDSRLVHQRKAVFHGNTVFFYTIALFTFFSYNHVRIYVKGQAKGAGIMANQKILIADDESRLRKLVRDYLTMKKYEVI